MKGMVLVLGVLTVPTVFGHGGGLNAQGCHTNHKTGDYHCHRLASASNVRTEESLPSVVPPSPPNADVTLSGVTAIVGVASVIDGDTLEVHGQRIRLFGIDAPESGQMCIKQAASYACGREAAFALSDKIAQRPISCTPESRDRYGRTVATCKLDQLDLNQWLVRNGHAVAYQQYSRRYVPDEIAAKSEGAGIWSGTFEMPWDWRRNRKREP